MRRLVPGTATAAVAAALLATIVVACGSQQTSSPPERRETPTAATTTGAGMRLYVFDCGTLQVDPARFRLKKEEVATTALSAACFLVAHPKGRLIWDPGVVPDADWTPTGAEVPYRVVLPDGATRDVKLRKRLVPQLAEAGYAPADITHLAFSHYHYDHTANANAFAGATWLVRQVERDAMFAEKPPSIAMPSSYSALKNSKTTIIESEEHDVFGDGTVILKLAAGHTPGHQVLFVKLPKTGAIVLSGDLYHFPEARALKRVAVFDVDQAQTPISRDAVEAFLTKTGAQLWIQHDDIANAKLKKAPDYYE
jgi:glyoxylase-like metal-dependent hydrolase (beta-lactamase superfamily II)